MNHPHRKRRKRWGILWADNKKPEHLCSNLRTCADASIKGTQKCRTETQ